MFLWRREGYIYEDPERKVVFSGVGYGQAAILPAPVRAAFQLSARTAASELSRFHHAQGNCIRELSKLYDQALLQVGGSAASIFAIYAMLMEDRDYQNTVCSFILSQGVTAEYAVYQTGETFAKTFSAMENDYMRARSADMRHVSNHLIDELTGYRELARLGTQPTILVDEEFSPVRMMELKDERVVGLVARQGSLDSHAAQLAYAMELPAIVRVPLDRALEGHWAILDGTRSQLYIDPTPEAVAQMEEAAEAEAQAQAAPSL